MHDPLRPPRVEELPAQVGRPPGATSQRRAPRPPVSSAAKRSRRLRFIPWFVLGLVALSFGLPIYFLFPVIRDAIQQSSLRDSGVVAPGEILAVRETSTTFNDQPVLELSLRILRADGLAYETEVAQPFSMLHAPHLRPGAGVRVKYDAAQPTSVVVVETGLASPFFSSTPRSSTPTPDTPSALPSAPAVPPVRDTTVKSPAICAAAHACCITVVGSDNSGSCATFQNPNFPQFGCETALHSLRQAAVAQGRQCPP